MILTLLTTALAADLTVPQGVYEVDGREVYTHGFTVDAKAGKEDRCLEAGKHRPTGWEWRIAAQQKGFKPSGAFEWLQTPEDAACDVNMAVVEAEGVGGHLYFAGWGQHQGEAEVLSGKGSVTEGLVRIHSNPWHFWGDEAKPAPRAERCIQREPAEVVRQKVLASSLNLRQRRDLQSEKVHNVGIGTELIVHWVQGDWAWVTAPKSVHDDSGTEPTIHTCTETGWTLQKYLVDELPSIESMAQQAESHLAAGRLAEALPLAERAAAWHSGNPALRELLATVYARVDSDHTARVQSEAKALRAAQPTVGWRPGKSVVSLATVCDRERMGVGWYKLGESTPGPACFIPWSEAGWIDLDFTDLGSNCGERPYGPLARQAKVEPESLWLQLDANPGGAARALHVRVRPMLGRPMEGEYKKEGWGPWRTVHLAETDGKGALIELPMSTLRGTADHRFELSFDVYTLGDDAAPMWSETVQVIWPVSC